jgi:16S rRNA C1402 N4-methylase RsmH
MTTAADRMPFGEVLEAVDRLTSEEQEDLAAILQRRLAERGRKRLAEDVREARREFDENACRSATADELIGEILP